MLITSPFFDTKGLMYEEGLCKKYPCLQTFVRTKSISKVYPFGQLDYIHLYEHSYTEHGAQSLDLHLSEHTSNMLRSETGLQGKVTFTVGNSQIMPSAKVGWVNETRYKGRHLTATLEDVGDSFTVRGIYPNRGLIAPGAALTGLFFKDRLNISVTYEGEFGKQFQNNAVNLSFIWDF